MISIDQVCFINHFLLFALSLSLSLDDETRRLQDEVEAARKVQEEATAAIIAASIPNHIHVRENDENDDLMMNGADLETNSSTEIPRPEEERETAVSKKKDLQEQLKVSSLSTSFVRDD